MGSGNTNYSVGENVGKKQCMGCMGFYSDEYDVCPNCGYEDGRKAESLLFIEPGFVLANRYIVGKVLGHGGFGVTYMGWDNQLKRRIAIKEYFPSEFATRMLNRQSLVINNNEEKTRRQFNEGKNKFLQEAQRLAKVSNIDGIVHMYDCFEANNTAYIVMEYLEGETLASYLEKNGQLSEDESIGMIIPVLKALEVIHEKGIIHRDLSPDNIFLTTDSKGDRLVKLIDFGSARFASTSHSKSLTVLIRQGYSPEEQYRSNGEQGTYTDVYSVAACLYKMITGIQPPDALERRTSMELKNRDLLEVPSKYNRNISDNLEIALMNALNVRIEDRTLTSEAFQEELVSIEKVKRRGSTIRRIDFLRWPLWAKVCVPIGGVAAIALLIAVGLWAFRGPAEIYTLPEGMTRVPDFVTASVEDAQSWAADASLSINSAGSEYAYNTMSGLVLSQDISSGAVVLNNSVVSVIVSTGEEKYSMPDVTGMTIADAKAALECMSLEVLTEEDSLQGLQNDCIISQDILPFTEVKSGQTVTLAVSTGAVYSKGKTIPDFVGLTFDEAVKAAGDAGIPLSIAEKQFSSDNEDGEVLHQSHSDGSSIKENETVELTVAVKLRKFSMPNLLYKPLDMAVMLLRNIGIEPEVKKEISELVNAGLVSSQSIEKDTDVSPEDHVVIIASTGGKPFAMPDVAGKSEKEALEILNGCNLSVSKEYGYKEGVLEGYVISQDIDAGEDVRRGTKVVIVVCSKNSAELVTVENVVGKASEESKKLLTSQGLKVQVKEIYHDTAKSGVVISQLPEAGAKQKAGTTVVLTVSKGKDPSKATEDATGSGTWSEWSSSLPAGINESGYYIESMTQYRAQYRQTTTSTSSSMPGWTMYNSASEWTGYGEWSDWSTSPAYESGTRAVNTKVQYRIREKQTQESKEASISGWTQGESKIAWGDYGDWSGWSTNPVTASESIEVQTRSVPTYKTQYNYSRYSSARGSDGRIWYGPWAGNWNYNTVYCGNYEERGWSDEPLPVVETQTAGNTTFAIYSGNWFNERTESREGPYQTEYRYRERNQETVYTYWQWGGWSDWMDSPYYESTDLQVETRTLYQYADKLEITTYYYEKWGEWSGYSDIPIYVDDNTRVQTRPLYRYKKK